MFYGQQHHHPVMDAHWKATALTKVSGIIEGAQGSAQLAKLHTLVAHANNWHHLHIFRDS